MSIRLFGGDEKRSSARRRRGARRGDRAHRVRGRYSQAALGALRGDVGKIDLDLLLREWSFFNALLERMRTELASSPFRAPARAVLRTASQSTELLQSLKPTLNELDGYMMSVWATRRSSTACATSSATSRAQLAKPKLERRPPSAGELGRGGEQRTRQRLQSVADDLSQLLGALQQLAIHPQTRQLQTTLQQAHESLEGAERSLAKLPSLLAILLQHLLRGDATEADAAIARVRAHLNPQKMVAHRLAAQAAAGMLALIDGVLTAAGARMPILERNLLTALHLLRAAAAGRESSASRCSRARRPYSRCL